MIEPESPPDTDPDTAMTRDEARALAQQVVEFRREQAELAATLVPLMKAIADWMALRNAIVTSLLARPIQWAIALCIVFGIGALIWHGQALEALTYATHIQGGGTSIVVTGQSPSSTPPPDGSTPTP